MKYSKSLTFIYLTQIFITFLLHTQSSTVQAQTAVLSDAIPYETPYIFGYEPKWQNQTHPLDHQKHNTYKWRVITQLWSAISEQANQLSPKWSEEEQKVWKGIASLPFPKTDEDLRQMGFDRPSAFWVYGLGLTPAFTIEIPNPQKLEKWAKSHLAHLEHTFQSIKHHTGTYWRKELNRWVLLLRLKEYRLKMALLPKRSEPILLSYFLRDQQKHSITNRIKSHFKAFIHGRGSGLINLHSFIDSIFGSQTPILKHSASSLGLPNTLFKPCEEDFRAIGQTLPIFTFGLLERDQGRVDILTHIDLDEKSLALMTPLTFLSHTRTPLEASDNYGGLATRMHFKAVFSILETLAQRWSAQPWTCPLLNSFNGLSSQMNTPQWNFLKGLLSPLKGFTLFLHKKDSVQIDRQRLPLQGWFELLYPSPHKLLSLLNQLGQLPKLPPTYYALDSVPKDWSLINPKLNRPLVSLSDKRLMASLGNWGEVMHKRMNQAIPSSQITSLNYSSPLLWLALPSDFVAWIKNKIEDYQSVKLGKAKIKNKEQLSDPQHLFKSFAFYLIDSGFMIKVDIDTKEL